MVEHIEDILHFLILRNEIIELRTRIFTVTHNLINSRPNLVIQGTLKLPILNTVKSRVKAGNSIHDMIVHVIINGGVR